MKARKLLFAALALALGFAACEKQSETPTTPNKESETYTVSLNLTGEIEVSQNPLTRFTPDDRDLYGIQVEYAPYEIVDNWGEPYPSIGYYKYYAFGLFDDISDLKIELLTNHAYRFTVLLVNDGKDKIYEDVVTINDVDYIGYGEPFVSYNHLTSEYDETVTPVLNKFIINEKDSNDRFEALYGGYRLKGMKYSNYIVEDLDVYYGLVENYIPETNHEMLSIFLKHMIFGVKICAGDFFTDGEITTEFWGEYVHSLTPDSKVTAHTYAYSGSDHDYGKYADNSLRDWYLEDELDDAYKYFNLSCTWNRADGSTVQWKNFNIKVNRLKETVVNLNYLVPESYDINMSVVYEDWEMETGTVYEYGDEQSEYEW